MGTREIKFRVWRPQLKRFRFFDISTGFNVENTDVFKSVEQYTGLKDNNSVEVYSCDVVEAFGGHVVGVVVQHRGAWMVKTDKGFEPLYEAYESCDLHVLGNIHENPELLTND